MKLLVDVGNSRVKWACLRQRRLAAGEPFPIDPAELERNFGRSWQNLPRPAAVYVSNVAGPDAENVLAGWVERHWRADLHLIRSAREACGVTNGYEDPLTLGVDRWVGMIGVRGLFRLPVCLVDCGTAITVDLLDEHGCHQGGLIAPGLGVMTEALMQRARGIGRDLSLARGFWGRSTGAGLASGVLQMALGLIERAVRQAQASEGGPLTLILTGGDAAFVSSQLNIPHQQVPDIVLHGLAVIAESAR